MTISEADRFAMHGELTRVHGEEVANIIMEHLPPAGWGDVARTHDVNTLREHMNLQFEGVNRRFEEVDRRFQDVDRRFQDVDRRFDGVDRRIDGLVHSMWAMTGIFSTAFIALFTLIASQG